MIAAPVNPAKKMEEMRPRFLGNRLEMCNWARLKHMPPPPNRITPGRRALKLECVLEQPRRIKPVTFSVVPASMKQSVQNRTGLNSEPVSDVKEWEHQRMTWITQTVAGLNNP